MATINDIAKKTDFSVATVSRVINNTGYVNLKTKQTIQMVDRGVMSSDFDGVFFENYNAAYMATRALINAGNKRLAIITGDLSLKLHRDRYNGFKEAIKESGFTLAPSDVYIGNFAKETAYELTKKFLSKDSLPDAVFTSNNKATLGFIKALNEKGLKLGEDIAAIGIDYVEMLDTMNLNFSYVRRDVIEIGRVAMRKLLLRTKESERKPKISIISGRMVCNFCFVRI